MSGWVLLIFIVFQNIASGEVQMGPFRSEAECLTSMERMAEAFRNNPPQGFRVSGMDCRHQ